VKKKDTADMTDAEFGEYLRRNNLNGMAAVAAGFNRKRKQKKRK
jgi:hypothetical protein